MDPSLSSSGATTTTAAAAIPSGSVSSSHTILLDSDIRDWVVLPLLIVMIAAGLLRHAVGILLKGSKVKRISKTDQRTKSDLTRVSRIKAGPAANLVSTSLWNSRRDYYATVFLRKEAEWTTKEAASASTSSNNGDSKDADDPLNNPMSMMMDGMMGNAVFMVQNMVMMQGISHFFKGYVLVKIPFPLTMGFKQMFQRGLDLKTLDTSYVSSVSWYFLVMFGLRGFFRLVIGDVSQETMESTTIQSQLGMQTGAAAAGGPQQQFDATKALNTEADNLELLPAHKSRFDDVEKRLLGKRYPKKKVKASGDDFFGYGTVGGSKKKKN